MAEQGLLGLAVAELIVIGGFFLLLPRIGRSGLLFGVYVGEEASRNAEARQIRARWSREVSLALVAALAIVLLAARFFGTFWATTVAPLTGIGLFFTAYLRAHRRARKLAVEGAPPAAAPLGGDPEISLAFPVSVTFLAAAWGLYSIMDGALGYSRLPERIPIHFGLSGNPDGWAGKSLASVMLLPFLALILGAGLGGATCLTARAKRVLRAGGSEATATAQRRFAVAFTRFMSGITLLTAALLNLLALFSLRVARGEATRLPPVIDLLVAVLLLYSLGGAMVLALRHGQGGSRHEARQGALSALTDGLADNRCWRLGLFYVNREDPSFLVENRFGLGYTLNFGNRAAVAVLATFLALVLGSVALALALL